MPLLVDKTKKKMVIVNFPLNDLEGDQVSILMFFFFFFSPGKDSLK